MDEGAIAHIANIVKKSLEPAAKTKGGKIINKLSAHEARDDPVTEMVPDPFGAEQTYLTEDDIN